MGGRSKDWPPTCCSTTRGPMTHIRFPSLSRKIVLLGNKPAVQSIMCKWFASRRKIMGTRHYRTRRRQSSLWAALKPICMSALIVAGTEIASDVTAKAEGDPARGEMLYHQTCELCHSLDANKLGPMHR